MQNLTGQSSWALGNFVAVFRVLEVRGICFAQSLLHQDGHIPHLSLIFMMSETEPFAHIPCQPRPTHQSWKFMAMFGVQGDQRTDRVVLSQYLWVICLAFLSVGPDCIYCTQFACLLMLYCNSAVGGQLTAHTDRRFSRMCANTFCQALFQCNYGNGAGGNYSSHT